MLCGTNIAEMKLVKCLLFFSCSIVKPKCRFSCHCISTEIACQNDDSVTKTDTSTSSICQLSILKQLQEELKHIRMRFFDFVKEYNTIGLATDFVS